MREGEPADETPALPWDRSQLPGWRATVESWSWKPLGGGDWEKSGTCLRCEHGMTVEKQGAYSASVTFSEGTVQELIVRANDGPFLAGDEAGDRFFARCDCAEEHPGRPAQLTRGCGQWALIDPPPDE